MRSLTTVVMACGLAVTMLVTIGCCENKDTAQSRAPERERVAVAPTPAPEPPPAPAPLPEPQYSERAGIKVSMYPLSSPPPPSSPPPRMMYAEAPPVYSPPVYTTTPVVASTGVCQIIPAGSTIISDPPTVTLSSTGEVIDRTGTTFSTAYAPSATVYAAAPQQTTSVYSPDPQTTVYTATTSYTQPEPIGGGPMIMPVTTTVSETRTVTYTPPATTTYTYADPTVTMAPAVYYPDAPPLTVTASQPGVYTPPAVGELRLVRALDVPSGDHPSDALPSQWYEILRPGNGPIRIGRVSSTCVCVSVRVPNRFIAAGERALIEARIVKRPPANNLTYGVFVNMLEPTQQTLDADITISY